MKRAGSKPVLMVGSGNGGPEDDQGNRDVSPGQQEKSNVICQKSPERSNYLGALGVVNRKIWTGFRFAKMSLQKYSP